MVGAGISKVPFFVVRAIYKFSYVYASDAARSH